MCSCYVFLMKAKPVQVTTKRRGAARKSQRKATTFRLDPLAQEQLTLLGSIRKMPRNRLVSEAVDGYLKTRLAEVEADLEETLRRLKAYRKTDSGFESDIAKFAEAEAVLAGEDPVEGKPAPAAGPAQRMVLELLRG